MPSNPVARHFDEHQPTSACDSRKSPIDGWFKIQDLGRLPDDFDGSVLLPYLTDASRETRYWAVKNLGKLTDIAYLPQLSEVAANDESSMVRREAVSSIGRMRNERAIPTLIRFLSDPDPSVIMQAIRGLLVFKSLPRVEERLLALREHPNELIQYQLAIEFDERTKSTDYGKHPESPDYLKNLVAEGDTREVMRLLPDGCLHLTFTSPPYYNARDYSIYASYQQYLDFLEEVFREVHRITKEGRFLIINTSPVIVARLSRKHSSRRYPIPFDINSIVTQMGWDFIDDIVWSKPDVTVKNRNGGFQQHRKPLGYKPNATTEYVMVYRKRSPRLLDWNMRQYPAEVIEASKVDGEFEKTNLWQIDPVSDKIHSAVFPDDLCDRVLQYYSYIGDLVFDPFAGSGTLGRAAQRLNRYFFLTELEPRYVERMKETLPADVFQAHSPRFASLDELATMIEGSD